MHGMTLLMLWLVVCPILTIMILADVVKFIFMERSGICDTSFDIIAVVAIGFGSPPVKTCSARPSVSNANENFQVTRNSHLLDADAVSSTFESVKFNEDGALNTTMVELPDALSRVKPHRSPLKK